MELFTFAEVLDWGWAVASSDGLVVVWNESATFTVFRESWVDTRKFEHVAEFRNFNVLGHEHAKQVAKMWLADNHALAFEHKS